MLSLMQLKVFDSEPKTSSTALSNNLRSIRRLAAPRWRVTEKIERVSSTVDLTVTICLRVLCDWLTRTWAEGGRRWNPRTDLVCRYEGNKIELETKVPCHEPTLSQWLFVPPPEQAKSLWYGHGIDFPLPVPSVPVPMQHKSGDKIFDLHLARNYVVWMQLSHFFLRI